MAVKLGLSNRWNEEQVFRFPLVLLNSGVWMAYYWEGIGSGIEWTNVSALWNGGKVFGTLESFMYKLELSVGNGKVRFEVELSSGFSMK
jgi:hypothetical protein